MEVCSNSQLAGTIYIIVETEENKPKNKPSSSNSVIEHLEAKTKSKGQQKDLQHISMRRQRDPEKESVAYKSFFGIEFYVKEQRLSSQNMNQIWNNICMNLIDNMFDLYILHKDL